jgi:hypothetical protein
MLWARVPNAHVQRLNDANLAEAVVPLQRAYARRRLFYVVNCGQCPEPKTLIILDGSAHAQYLFPTVQAERVRREIPHFLQANGRTTCGLNGLRIPRG